METLRLKRTNRMLIISQYFAVFHYQVDRDIKVVEEIVLLEHMTHTDLAQVGLQVWRGALLLADWLLQNRGQVFFHSSISSGNLCIPLKWLIVWGFSEIK